MTPPKQPLSKKQKSAKKSAPFKKGKGKDPKAEVGKAKLKAKKATTHAQALQATKETVTATNKQGETKLGKIVAKSGQNVSVENTFETKRYSWAKPQFFAAAL